MDQHLHYRSPRRKREKEAENFEEIMVKNLSNLGKKTPIQVQEDWRVPNKMNSKRYTTTHIIIRVSIVKDKEKFLKQQRTK